MLLFIYALRVEWHRRNYGALHFYSRLDDMSKKLRHGYTVGNVTSVSVQGQKVEMEEAFNLSNLMLTAFISFRTW
ncbi:MAG: hypothetical protein GX371_10270 [Bacteroidales bacterium]|nr:hypothetical protein [Bacteroidales bacterium]